MKITDKEKQSILAYQGFNYKLFNSILEVDMSAESDFIRDSRDEAQTFTHNDIEELIENIKLIYSAMLKYSQNNKSIGTVYRGTSQSDIDRINNRNSINKFLSTTYDQSMARGYFSLSWDNPVFIGIHVEPEVPFLDIGAVIDDYGENGEREVLLSPFLNVDKLDYVRSEQKSCEAGVKTQKFYSMEVKKGELPELTEEERTSLRSEILESTESISSKQAKYFKIIKEIEEVEDFIEMNNEKITKIKNYLANPAISSREKKELEDDLEYLTTTRAEELRETCDRLQNEKGILGVEVESWKKKVVQLCKANCRTVEKDIELQIAEEKAEAERSREEARAIREQKIIARIENTRDLHSTTCKTVSTRVDKIGRNASNALSFKNKLAKLGKDMGISYISYIDELSNIPSIVNVLSMRMNDFSNESIKIGLEHGGSIDGTFLKSEQVREACERIFDTCSNMDTIPLKELKDLEEESFKNGLSNKVLDIKLGIFAKVLETEYAKLNNVRGMKKFLYKLTGKEKANERRKEKLYQSLRQIFEQRKEMKSGTRFEERVSFHQILADVKLLEAEYGRDPSFAQEISALENLREVILGDKMSEMYIIDETKADKIANNMSQSRFPIERDKNFNKSDLIMNQVSALAQKEHKQPPERMDFNIERSIREMGEIMRVALNNRSRTKEVARGVDR